MGGKKMKGVIKCSWNSFSEDPFSFFSLWTQAVTQSLTAWLWKDRSLTGHHKILIISLKANPSPAAQSVSAATIQNGVRLSWKNKELQKIWENSNLTLHWSLYESPGACKELIVTLGRYEVTQQTNPVRVGSLKPLHPPFLTLQKT